MFQKWTVFVFTESLSGDQVMQRAYRETINYFHFLFSGGGGWFNNWLEGAWAPNENIVQNQLDIALLNVF